MSDHLDPDWLNACLDAAKAYAHRNLKQGATEMLEHSATGILQDGVVRRCADILPFRDSLGVARELFQYAALEYAALR
jgi:hypothetical protein